MSQKSIIFSLTGKKFIITSIAEKHGANIVYYDTDSIMFNIPGVTDIKEYTLIGNSITEEIYKINKINTTFVFDKETYIKPLLKKKYLYKGIKDESKENIFMPD